MSPTNYLVEIYYTFDNGGPFHWKGIMKRVLDGQNIIPFKLEAVTFFSANTESFEDLYEFACGLVIALSFCSIPRKNYIKLKCCQMIQL